jgi:hypothetical protein
LAAAAFIGAFGLRGGIASAIFALTAVALAIAALWPNRLSQSDRCAPYSTDEQRISEDFKVTQPKLVECSKKPKDEAVPCAMEVAGSSRGDDGA